jgi:polyisoprenoid-binding protein YceI
MSKWNLDPAHSEAQFKVRHMMVSNVSGYFRDISASLQAEKEDLSDAEFQFEAKIDSIDTRQKDRDAHLKSADFFDAENHPLLTFNSTSVEVKDGNWLIKGDLSIRGISKSVELKAEYFGQVVDPYGQTKAAFEIEGKISRKDFDLTWNAVTEAGSIVVADEVKLLVNAQFVKA